MTKAEIKSLAKNKGITIPKEVTKKADIIRYLQRAEGNFDCFGTAVDFCDQNDCCYRRDCLGKNA